MQAECIWKTAKLHWQKWEGEYIVYNATSGNTHLLNATAAQALKMLERKPASVADISNQLTSSAGLNADEEVLQQVEALVANLDELGLVEPV